LRRQLRRIELSPFVSRTTSLRGFVFDVATGALREVQPA
jgi:carbonic anhydrase